MPYTSTVPFEGNTEKAFDLAIATLTSLGFRLTARDNASMELHGPGMTSSRQSGLVGASHIQFRRGSRDLSLNAELGGVRTMTRFVALFPIGLSLGLGVIFFIIFSFLFDIRQWAFPALVAMGLNVLVWLALAPMMARSFRARTEQALDALLNNMVMTATA